MMKVAVMTMAVMCSDSNDSGSVMTMTVMTVVP